MLQQEAALRCQLLEQVRRQRKDWGHDPLFRNRGLGPRTPEFRWRSPGRTLATGRPGISQPPRDPPWPTTPTRSSAPSSKRRNFIY
jgi:hypothetical protein